jgi:hypothetical protein
LKIAEMLAVREGWKRSESRSGETSFHSKKAPLPGSEFSLAGGALASLKPQEDIPAPAPVAPAPAEAQGNAPELSAASAPVSTTVSPAGASAAVDPVEDAVNKSMKEARRRYPAIGVEGSAENKVFLEAYQDLEGRRTDFFEKPDWPVRLAELVAKQEGWKRVEAPGAGK